MLRFFDSTSENFASLRPTGSPLGMPISTAIKITNKIAAMVKTEGTNPNRAKTAAPNKKPAPFTAFFEPVKTATQRNNPLSPAGANNLTALLELIFAKSFATPDNPWTNMTKITDAVSPQAGFNCDKANRAITCKLNPAYNVAFNPKRAAIQPADRLVITPAISYKTNR